MVHFGSFLFVFTGLANASGTIQRASCGARPCPRTRPRAWPEEARMGIGGPSSTRGSFSDRKRRHDAVRGRSLESLRRRLRHRPADRTEHRPHFHCLGKDRTGSGRIQHRSDRALSRRIDLHARPRHHADGRASSFHASDVVSGHTEAGLRQIRRGCFFVTRVSS